MPLLISQDLIKAEDIDYENCLTLKGAFDKNNTHSIPTATVKVRSPRFLYDKNVETKAGVLTLPKGVNCLIGNALFKNHAELTDVIALRRDNFGLPDKQQTEDRHAGVIDCRT